MTRLVEVLDGADVVVCVGSGGVGKTTTAAVMGIEAARMGRRVVVVTIDPARRLADALGLPDGLSGRPRRIELGEGSAGELWAMMLDTAAMFERVVRTNAVDANQADRIVENRFYQNMAGALSGTQEFMASEALHELHGDERFDLVIVDTPPSRNALDFLESAGVLARFLEHRAFKLMMMPTRSGLKVLNAAGQPILRAIGRVVGSDVLTDAVAFFQAFAGMEVGFRQRADAVNVLLRADSTRFVLVTAPQRDTIVEATWFADQLAEQGFTVHATIVNRMQPRFGDSPTEAVEQLARQAESSGDAEWAAMWSNLADLHRASDAQHAELAPLIDRLGSDSVVEVPLLPTDVHDLEALDLLGAHLFGVDGS